MTKEESYLSFEQAMQKCQENNINVLYSYDSFSYQQVDEWQMDLFRIS